MLFWTPFLFRAVVFLPSSTAALKQEGICNAEKTSHPPLSSAWAESRAGSSCAAFTAWAQQSCSCPLGSAVLQPLLGQSGALGP